MSLIQASDFQRGVTFSSSHAASKTVSRRPLISHLSRGESSDLSLNVMCSVSPSYVFILLSCVVTEERWSVSSSEFCSFLSSSVPSDPDTVLCYDEIPPSPSKFTFLHYCSVQPSLNKHFNENVCKLLLLLMCSLLKLNE